MRSVLLSMFCLVCITSIIFAQDARLSAPRWEYEAYAPFRQDIDWKTWRHDLRRDIRVTAGLWPEPTKSSLEAVVHSKKKFDGYSVSKVYFQSMPGHFVTGNLYQPHPLPERSMPIALCPYGHWPQGRFMDYKERKGNYGATVALESGGEVSMTPARSMLQARCVQLARMGCAVFIYDMIGRADSVQMDHPAESKRWENPESGEKWGFESPRAVGHLQSMFGLQLWNGIRAIDFMQTLPGVDPDKVFVTGASGGGKQTIYLFAADQRVSAAEAGVALGSGRYEAGCLCGKSPGLLVGHGLVDLAASGAPRPFAFAEGGGSDAYKDQHLLPFMKRIYAFENAPENVEVFVNTGYGHTYNLHARRHMYSFLNRHLNQGLETPITESDFTFLSEKELSVWSAEHPAPPQGNRGAEHEKAICSWWASDARSQMQDLFAPRNPEENNKARAILEPAWLSLVGRVLPKEEDMDVIWEEPDGNVANALVVNKRFGEEVRIISHRPLEIKRRLIIISPQGAEQINIADFQPLLQADYEIILPDLFLQSAPDKRPSESPGMQCAPNNGKKRRGKHAAPSSVYALHPPLITRRAHDILNLIAALQTDKPIDLLALPGTGQWAMMAMVADNGTIKRAAVHLDGFVFSSVHGVWDENFLPGALKYGDIQGLMATIAPRVLFASGARSVDENSFHFLFPDHSAIFKENLSYDKSIQWLTQERP